MGVRKDCFCECVDNMKRNLREHFNMGQPGDFVVLLGNNGGLLGAGTLIDFERDKVVLFFPGQSESPAHPPITFEVSVCCICSIQTFDMGQVPGNDILNAIRRSIIGIPGQP